MFLPVLMHWSVVQLQNLEMLPTNPMALSFICAVAVQNMIFLKDPFSQPMDQFVPLLTRRLGDLGSCDYP